MFEEGQARPKFTAVCNIHGDRLKRDSCRECNAAYMKRYQRDRRTTKPLHALVERARKRARTKQLPCDLHPDQLKMPEYCPALGIKLIVGGQRSDCSPSLDRIIPALGYVSDNVRVISDRANRLKGRCSLAELESRRNSDESVLAEEYALLVSYVRREQLRMMATRLAAKTQNDADAWSEVAEYLREICEA